MTGWMKKLKKNKKLRKHIITKFELDESWIEKFLVGVAEPHPRLRKLIMKECIKFNND